MHFYTRKASLIRHEFFEDKKNHNEEISDEEYVVSAFSYISISSSNNGKATVSSGGGAQRMRESFLMHFNAVAFGFVNENLAAGTTGNAKTRTTTASNKE